MDCLALLVIPPKKGTAIEVNIDKTAITITNSTREKPFCSFLIISSLILINLITYNLQYILFPYQVAKLIKLIAINSKKFSRAFYFWDIKHEVRLTLIVSFS